MAKIRFDFEILSGEKKGQTFSVCHKTRAKKIRSKDVNAVIDGLVSEGRLPYVKMRISQITIRLGGPNPDFAPWTTILSFESDEPVYKYLDTLLP